MNVLRSKRAVAGLGAALVSIVGLTLFVVLPALASNSGDRIPPAAVPSGSRTGRRTGSEETAPARTSSPRRSRALPSLHEYDNVNPGTATGLSSGNGDGVTFSLSLTGPSQKQVLSARLDERRDRRHRDQGRVGVGGVRLHGALSSLPASRRDGSRATGTCTHRHRSTRSAGESRAPPSFTASAS